jgi:hypothetical protein
MDRRAWICASLVALAGCDRPAPPRPPPSTLEGAAAFSHIAILKLTSLSDLKRTEGEPYVRGKYVFIDGDEGNWAKFNAECPAGLVASKPEEAGTIFLATLASPKLSDSQGLRPDVKTQLLRVQVIDLATKSIVGEGFFASKQPPSPTAPAPTVNELMAATKPELLAWLEKLPRRSRTVSPDEQKGREETREEVYDRMARARAVAEERVDEDFKDECGQVFFEEVLKKKILFRMTDQELNDAESGYYRMNRDCQLAEFLKKIHNEKNRRRQMR